MEPASGNVLIRRSKEFFIRIPIGTNSLECECRFLGVRTIRDDPAIVLSFPLSGIELTQRRYYRAKLLSAPLHQVIIRLPDDTAAGCSLLDIGVNGLAFENPWPPDKIPVGTQVVLLLDIANFSSLRLEGVIRSHIKCRVKSDKNGVSHRCGVQFCVEDHKVARQLALIVTAIQGEHLRCLRERAFEAGIELMLA
ncbi:MAG: hypothetical protein BWK76_03815 [Desulfobulbaceae bacterium A2]|nr:MAG: hypothetical protein BWK76_03815 [Desulfobulbaceae bacterium A2]